MGAGPRGPPSITDMVSPASGSGLEDQLLGQVVAEERPDLEEAKNQLIVSNAKMHQELKDIEDQILYRLSSSEGNPVDDMELIKVLEASKMKAAEIQVGSCQPALPARPACPPCLPLPTCPYPLPLVLCQPNWAWSPPSTAPPGQGQDCRADREGHRSHAHGIHTRGCPHPDPLLLCV